LDMTHTPLCRTNCQEEEFRFLHIATTPVDKDEVMLDDLASE